MVINVESNKELFKSTVKEFIKKEGVDQFLEYLETTTFYTDPASSKFHCDYIGGLVEHSLNVFEELSKSPYAQEYGMETIAFVSLFHDVCKAGIFKEDFKNQKNSDGMWERVPYFAVDDKFPFGHGEKSVYLLMKYGFSETMTDEEAFAINWHMGSFDYRIKGGYYNSTDPFSMSKLALELHIADMRATHILESKCRKI